MIRVIATAMAIAARRVTSQPAGLVFAGLFYLMVTAVVSGLWNNAAKANGGEIVGYTATALVWYIATSEASIMALPQRLIEDTGTAIGEGHIEAEMLRPVSVLAVRVATQIGQALPQLGVIIAIGIPFALFIGGAPPDGVALTLALPSLLLAITLNLVTQHLFAAAAFWIRDAKSAWFLYQKSVFVVGGMLLPLEILPSSLEIGAKVLPFSAMAYAPARLASGHVEPHLLLVQAAWLAAMGALAVRVYAVGERRVMDARV